MKLARRLLAWSAVGVSLAAQAESDVNTGAAPGLSAIAHLNLRLTVPRMIFLRVGSGTYFADLATINRVTFTVPAANVGSGVTTAGVPSAGAIVARVLGNGGNVSFRASGTLGGLASGANRIPWTQITPNVLGGALPHPAIGNGVAGAVTNLVAANGVVNQIATYTFTYNNSAPVASGTYNGRVTYTASLP